MIPYLRIGNGGTYVLNQHIIFELNCQDCVKGLFDRATMQEHLNIVLADNRIPSKDQFDAMLVFDEWRGVETILE